MINTIVGDAGGAVDVEGRLGRGAFGFLERGTGAGGHWKLGVAI